MMKQAVKYLVKMHSARKTIRKVNILCPQHLFILLTLISLSFSTKAQDTTVITGRVLSGNNMPVSNVAIGIEGSVNLPSITNELGEFTLTAEKGNEWLNVSPPSDYKNKRVFLGKRNELTIFLTPAELASGEDEILFLSEGIKQKNLVSSASTVNADNIIYTPVLSVDEYLQGRLSGMHVLNRSGYPGSGAVIQIRGVNSFLPDNRPLFIVDGIPVNSTGVFNSNILGYEPNALLAINPLDVSKITVLKDASLTSVYGSKASNGVVLIETLNPSVTETVIEIDYRSGYALAPEKNLPQLNASQHKTLASEVLFSSGMFEEKIMEEYPSLFLTSDDDRYVNYQHNTIWQDFIFTDAAMNNFNIKVKGGDEIARYGLSFGYADANGIIRNTGFDSYNLRFVGLLNIFQWLKMNAGVSLNYLNATAKESALTPETSPILTSLLKSPMLNPYRYDSKGKELSILANVDELGVSNPLAVIENHEAKNTSFNFTSTLGFIAEITSDLTFHTNFGLNYDIMKEENFRPNIGMERYDQGEAINVSQATNNTLAGFYTNNFLAFNKKFNNNHSLSSLTGFQLLNNNYQYDWALTRNSHENDQYRMLQDGTHGLWDIGGDNRIWNWASVYEYLSYSFQDKYLASASVSLDASSRVGAEAENALIINSFPLGLFYSLGVGWRISNESFMQNLSVIEELKLRASYGRTGNDNIGESTANNYYQIVKFRNSTGLYPALLPNSNLGYELTTKINGGLDFSFLGGRFSSSVDYYQSVSEDLIVYAPLNSYFGFDYRPENNGKLENKSIELRAFLRILDKPNFKIDVEAWYTTLTNKIVEIKGDKLVHNFPGGQGVNMKGEQSNSFYGYIYKGVYTDKQEVAAYGLVNERNIPYQPGDAIYEDISGPAGTPDGVINVHDKTVLGSSLPEQYGGVRNTYTFKRWSLSYFIQFVQGNEVFNYLRYLNERMIGLENQSQKTLARWQYEGQVTEIPRAVMNDPIGNSDFSTRWIEDGSFARLKNIYLSYAIPNKFLLFRSAQFYISANNVFTLSNYLGYDPEFSHSFSHITQGIDYGLTPQTRQFMAGIKLGL